MDGGVKSEPGGIRRLARSMGSSSRLQSQTTSPKVLELKLRPAFERSGFKQFLKYDHFWRCKTRLAMKNKPTCSPWLHARFGEQLGLSPRSSGRVGGLSAGAQRTRRSSKGVRLPERGSHKSSSAPNCRLESGVGRIVASFPCLQVYADFFLGFCRIIRSGNHCRAS